MEDRANVNAETMDPVTREIDRALHALASGGGDLPDHANRLGGILFSPPRVLVRVTPRGGRDAVTVDDDGGIHIRVTAAPEDGKANAAVRKLLAKALGIAPTRLTLTGGATSRDKLFRVD